jgi:hypothetical protein
MKDELVKILDRLDLAEFRGNASLNASQELSHVAPFLSLIPDLDQRSRLGLWTNTLEYQVPHYRPHLSLLDPKHQ